MQALSVLFAVPAQKRSLILWLGLLIILFDFRSEHFAYIEFTLGFCCFHRLTGLLRNGSLVLLTVFSLCLPCFFDHLAPSVAD